MDRGSEGADPAWEAEFVENVRRGLATNEARRQLTVERADVDAGEVVTALRFAGAPPRGGAAGCPYRPNPIHGAV